MESENTFNNIDEVLSNIPDNYKIMEEIIDLEIQKDYFELIRNLEFNPETESIIELIDLIKNQNSPAEEVKISLTKLAMFDEVEAFRAIEAYNLNPVPELKEWTLLALQQSRMVIQSSLMGEQQVFISTGLGGKDNKLRYYIIFPFNKLKSLSIIQSNALSSEIKFFLGRNEGIVEDIEFHEHFATSMVLLPITTNIPELVKEILYECNQLGNFLLEDVLITNMKRFSYKEIMEIIEKYDQKQG